MSANHLPNQKRYTLFATNAMLANEKWIVPLAMGIKPNQMIVRSVRFQPTINDIDDPKLMFVCADFVLNSRQGIIASFHAEREVIENTTFDNAGVIIDNAIIEPKPSHAEPNSHFMINSDMINTSVTFTVLQWDAATNRMVAADNAEGTISLHLEFVEV